jgi:hypothetical protein
MPESYNNMVQQYGNQATIQKVWSFAAGHQKKISEAEQYQLDLIAEGIFDFNAIDDVLRYLH